MVIETQTTINFCPIILLETKDIQESISSIDIGVLSKTLKNEGRDLPLSSE